MHSHQSFEEAQARGVPFAAWLGNAVADDFAGKAAAAHAIPGARLSCYKWAVATGIRIRQRILRATLNAFDNEVSGPSARQVRRAQRRSRPNALPQAQATSSHVLIDLKSRWSCNCCHTSASKLADRKHLNDWLTSECLGPPREQPQQQQLAAGTRLGHPSHTLVFYEPYWVCTACGCRTLSGRGHLRGLAEECKCQDGQAPSNMGAWVISRVTQGRPLR